MLFESTVFIEITGTSDFASTVITALMCFVLIDTEILDSNTTFKNGSKWCDFHF